MFYNFGRKIFFSLQNSFYRRSLMRRYQTKERNLPSTRNRNLMLLKTHMFQRSQNPVALQSPHKCKHVSNCEWLNHNALWNSIRPFSFYYLKIFFWVDCILCELPAKMCSCWNSWVLLICTLFFKFHNNFFFHYL